jgi:type IV secretory pathway VirB2 component (pilin)
MKTILTSVCLLAVATQARPAAGEVDPAAQAIQNFYKNLRGAQDQRPSRRPGNG